MLKESSIKQTVGSYQLDVLLLDHLVLTTLPFRGCFLAIMVFLMCSQTNISICISYIY